MGKIGLCLVGAGVWAKMQHLPAILENENVQLRAVYSRNRASAENLAPPGVDIYYDSPRDACRSLDDALRRTDIQAVVCCLPILVQLDFVKRCLLAGKHVLSEKPIAGDVASAAALVNWYREAQEHGRIAQGLVWGVAEEFRLLPAMDYARQQIAQLGKILAFSTQGYLFMGPGNPFFDTSWRKVPGYQGGFLLDGGVHWTAALIHLLGDEKIARVSAYTTLLHEHLAPVDTVHATVQLESGVSGTFGYSAAIAHQKGSGMDFEVVCEQGRVVVERAGKKIRVTVTSDGNDSIEEFDSTLNTRYELSTFAKSIQNGSEESGETPESAVLDLLLMQAMIESGEAGGIPKALHIDEYFTKR